MDYNQIISSFKNKVYQPVYFLMGEEAFFIDAISDYIENNVLDENEKEFNQTILYGRDTDVLTIISAAKRFPMMANHQVVIVKEAQNIRDLAGRDKGEDAEDTEEKTDAKAKSPLQTYIENPQRSTILVICYKYKTIDKRKAIAKSLAKNAVLFDSKKLYDNQVPDWISTYLKGKSNKIDPRAAALLTEYLGNDLSKIANELDKLIINIPDKSEITIDHIQNNIGISKDFNVFELQNAFGKRDVFKANRIINYFAANPKDHPLVMTLSALYGYFSKILMYHSLADKSRNNAAAALGVHPFFVGDYENAARSFPPTKVKAIISYLREYDMKSKGYDNGSASHGDLMKEMVFKIMH